MQDGTLVLKIIPVTLAMLSNTILTLINIYHNKNSPNILFGINLGTIFSNLIGYLLIISLNIGLGSEISKAVIHITKKNRAFINTKISIYYQRALVVNMMCCVFIITPTLYVSWYVLGLNDFFKAYEMLETTSQYLFQLVPSIYSFTYFDTTRVFLEAQGVRIAPMLILMCAIVMHYFLSQFFINYFEEAGMGAAWAKNITDSCCALALYLYVSLSGVVRKVWSVEWSMECMFNWKAHFKMLQRMGMTTYIEAFMFAGFSMAGSNLEKSELIIHICFINWSQVFFVLFLGLKQGILNHIHRNKFQLRQKFRQGMWICISLVVLLNFLMIVYKEEAASFFINDTTIKVSTATYLIFLLSNIVDSLQICVAGLLKSIDVIDYILAINVVCYCGGLGMSCFLAYQLQWGIKGLWIGWTLGLLLNLLLCLRKLEAELDRQQTGEIQLLTSDNSFHLG